MNEASRRAGNDLISGTVRVFAAEALLLPTGLITAAYLTRTLGPADYGLFTLASTIVAWIEWTITSIFARATFKFVAEAEDWRPVGSTVVRLHTVVSCLAATMLWFAAPALAHGLREPALALYLRVLALDIPLFSLAHAHRNILIGLRNFTQRAVTSAARWITRLIFIVLLVQLGLSVMGAIIGSILASLMEFLVARFYVRPPLFGSSHFPASKLWTYAVPLFLFAISMRVYEKLDLITLKALGATAATAGQYGAALNISLIFNIFALAFSPLLLSTLTSVLVSGNEQQAREISRTALRGVIVLLPFTVLIAGSSREIVHLVFGEMFVPAAPILSWLVLSGLAMLMLSVSTAILTAASHPTSTFVLAVPMIPLSMLGYLLVIPNHGAPGAAAVNAAVAFIFAAVSLSVVKSFLQVTPPLYTALRAAALSTGTYFLAISWPATGLMLILKLILFSAGILLAFLALREFRMADISAASSFLLLRPAAARRS